MNENGKEIARKAVGCADEATQLLRMSNQIHQAEKKGLIDERSAMKAVIKLNNQAIAKVERAIELQKKFLAEQQYEKSKLG